MLRETKRVLTVFVLAVMMSGCQGGGVGQSSSPPLQLQEKVIAKDWILKQRIRVASQKPARVSGDLLQIKLGLENTKKTDIWCDIQVVFYDQDGFETERTNWQPLLLPGNQIAYFETVSLSSVVRDYTVFLRHARKSMK